MSSLVTLPFYLWIPKYFLEANQSAHSLSRYQARWQSLLLLSASLQRKLFPSLPPLTAPHPYRKWRRIISRPTMCFTNVLQSDNPEYPRPRSARSTNSTCQVVMYVVREGQSICFNTIATFLLRRSWYSVVWNPFLPVRGFLNKAEKVFSSALVRSLWLPAQYSKNFVQSQIFQVSVCP